MPRVARLSHAYDDEIPDMERHFIAPTVAQHYRSQHTLEELVDMRVQGPKAYNVHVNICRNKVPVLQKIYLIHVEMDDGDVLDVIYDFKTILPDANQLIQMAMQDFGHYIVRCYDEVTEH